MRTPVGLSLASPWGRGAVALVAGSLPVLAFPEPSLWWFAYVALVPWMLLVRSAPTGRRAALEGWLGGIGFMIAVHHWLAPSLHVFLVVLAALLGLLWAPWGWLVRSMLGGAPSPGRAAAAVAVVPSGWLVIELVRSWQGLGGPWGLLGASQWEVAPALRLASVGGVWLVSLLVVAVNTALTVVISVPHMWPLHIRALRIRPLRIRLMRTWLIRIWTTCIRPARIRPVGIRPVRPRLTGAVSLVLCAVVLLSVWNWAPEPERSGTARIAVVQPGIVEGGTDARERRFAQGENLTRTLAGQDLDLVVWGESSVSADLATSPDLAARLAVLSRAVGAEILVNTDARGTDSAGTDGIFKRAVLVGPNGPTGDTYDKMRLVPFGEYIPARAALGWATSVGRAADEDRERGTRQVVMVLPGEGRGGLRFGPLVCFESAFPDMSRQLVRDGAQLLVAQSSTSTFQGSWAPEQHVSLAALRAAETGRPMVHATLTGTSAAFGPDGERVGSWIGTERSATGVFDVPLARGTTPYVEYGDWALYAALAVLAALCATDGARSFRKRSGPVLLVPPARTPHESATRPER